MDRDVGVEVDRGIDLAEGVVHQVPQGARELNTDRARADDDERQRLASPRDVGLDRGALEDVEDMSLQGFGVG